MRWVWGDVLVWAFFTVCLVFYLFFEAYSGPVLPLAQIFNAFQIGAFLFAVRWVYRNYRRFSKADAVFWMCTALVVIFPGAYLEYPADPMEHVRRIFYWQNLQRVSDHPIGYKFAYFLNWSLLRFLPLNGRELGLDAVSAAWQLLVLSQIYRLARALGQEPKLAKLQVLGFLFLFGTNVFNIRYYALSSTPLSYFAFLELVIAVLQKASWKKALVMTPCLTLLMYFNHQWQEIGFALIIVPGIFCYRALIAIPKAKRDVAIAGLVVLAAASYGLGDWLYRNPPASYLQKGLIHYYTSLGFFAVWRPGLPYLPTMGMHGVISLFLGLVLCRRYGMVAFLAWLPVSLLLLPPLVYLVSQAISENYATYRILYAFPISFLTTCLIWDFAGWLTGKWGGLIPSRWSIAMVLVLITAAPWNRPWRGRLVFALINPSSQMRVGMEVLPGYFWQERGKLNVCRLYGDDPSIHHIATHLGLERFPVRQKPETLRRQVGDVTRLVSKADVYGVLIPDAAAVPAVKSLVAKRSFHWSEQTGSRLWYLEEGVQDIEQTLSKHGWKMEQISPYYRLYRNPKAACGS